LVIKESKLLTVSQGLAPVSIRAGSILLEKGARIVASGTPGSRGRGGQVLLHATTTFTMQSMGTSKSKIDASGEDIGGAVEVVAGGAVDINGALVAKCNGRDCLGGSVNIVSETSTVYVQGDGIKATGGDRGENGASGGHITIDALSDMTIGAPLDVSGGDCICDISLYSVAGSVATTAAADFDLHALGKIGDGGATFIDAGGDVDIAGDVFAIATGSAGDFGFGGGFGGNLDVFAGGSVDIVGHLDMEGGLPDGDGGFIDVFAVDDLIVTGDVASSGKVDGGGGFVTLEAGDDLSVSGAVDVRSATYGGDIELLAGGDATVEGALRADAEASDGLGGRILVDACAIETSAASLVDARGLGVFQSASNVFRAGGTMTIRGRLLAGVSNRLEYRATPPTIVPPPLPPPTLSPAATIVENPALACCVDCS